jgi:hypothetical protein
MLPAQTPTTDSPTVTSLDSCSCLKKLGSLGMPVVPPVEFQWSRFGQQSSGSLGMLAGQAVAEVEPGCLRVTETPEVWRQKSKQVGTTARRSLSTSRAQEGHRKVVVVVEEAEAVQRSPDAAPADSRDRR